MKKRTRATAIRDFCLECSGFSSKDVSLCFLVSCPLWEFRFGNSAKSKAYKQRMKRAIEKYPKELDDIRTFDSEAVNLMLQGAK